MMRYMKQPAPVVLMQQVERAFTRDSGVFELSFEVPAGSIFGLIGPSGSGKTTTLRLLLGLYEPDHGMVRVLGKVPTHFSGHMREQIGYMPQQFVLYPNL